MCSFTIVIKFGFRWRIKSASGSKENLWLKSLSRCRSRMPSALWAIDKSSYTTELLSCILMTSRALQDRSSALVLWVKWSRPSSSYQPSWKTPDSPSCLSISQTITLLTSTLQKFQRLKTRTRSDWQTSTTTQDRVSLLAWSLYSLCSRTNITLSILEDCSLVFSWRASDSLWKKPCSSGSKSLQRRWTVTSSRRITPTMWDICSARKVKEMITSRGTARKSLDSKLQAKVSSMAVLSRHLETTTLDLCFRDMVLALQTWKLSWTRRKKTFTRWHA